MGWRRLRIVMKFLSYLKRRGALRLRSGSAEEAMGKPTIEEPVGDTPHPAEQPEEGDGMPAKILEEGGGGGGGGGTPSSPARQTSQASASTTTEGKGKKVQPPNLLLLTKEWQDLELKLEGILEQEGVEERGEDFDMISDESLKHCLLCFSIFPDEWAIRKGEYEAMGIKAEEDGAAKKRDDWAIKKTVVIYWWIGEEFVEAEERGEERFAELLELGFIEPVYNKRSKVVRECKVHPMVRWMLIAKARKLESDFFFELDCMGKPSDSPPRSCLTTNTNPSFLSDIKPKSPATASKSSNRIAPLLSCCDLSRGTDQASPSSESSKRAASTLQTLFNVSARCLNFGRDSFSKLKMLTVLQIGRWHGSAKYHMEVGDSEFLIGIGSLTSLRYLGLQGVSRVTELPDSIQKLQRLLVLDLRGCQNLEKLTVGVTKLKRLTHLDLTECYMLEQIPSGLGSLSELRVLKGFVFGSSKKSKGACKLAELRKLSKLRKLSINITSESRIRDGEMDVLRKFESLRRLTITWGDVPVILTDDQRKQMLERRTKLELPSDLEKLDLRCFPKENLPDWLEPTEKLTKLYIRGGNLQSLVFKNSGRDWKIEILRLRYLNHLVMNWPEVKGALKNLNYFEFVIHDKPDQPKSEHGDLPDELDPDGIWVKDKESEAGAGAPAAGPPEEGAVMGDEGGGGGSEAPSPPRKTTGDSPPTSVVGAPASEVIPPSDEITSDDSPATSLSAGAGVGEKESSETTPPPAKIAGDPSTISPDRTGVGDKDDGSEASLPSEATSDSDKESGASVVPPPSKITGDTPLVGHEAPELQFSSMPVAPTSPDTASVTPPPDTASTTPDLDTSSATTFPPPSAPIATSASATPVTDDPASATTPVPPAPIATSASATPVTAPVTTPDPPSTEPCVRQPDDAPPPVTSPNSTPLLGANSLVDAAAPAAIAAASTH